MNTVPGLTPMQRQGGRMVSTRARAQSPDAGSMRPPALNPTARPVDTYTRQDIHPQDNTLEALATGLAALNPAIARFSAAYQEDNPADSVAEIQRAKVEMKPEEFDAAVRNGSLPGLRTAAGYELAGKDRGFDFLTKLEADYQSFDPATQDFDSFVRDRIGEYSKDLPSDRMFQSNFYDTVYRGVETLRQKNTVTRSGIAAEETRASQLTVWDGTIRQMETEGKTSDEMVQAVFKDFDTNAQFRGIGYNDQQKMVLMLADRLATQGDTETARKLIETSRQFGDFHGSISTNPAFADQAQSLLARIQKQEDGQLEEMKIQSAEQALKDNLTAIGAQGGIPFITDVELPAKNGGTKKVSVEDQKKMWADDDLARSQKIAAYRKETPEQTRTRELAEFSQNGVKHPQWEQVLKSGYMASGLSSATDPNVRPPGLKEGWETYQWINAQNPQYLGTMLSSREVDYYEAIRIGMETHGDLDRAFLDAQYATNDVDGKTSKHRAARDQDIQSKVSGMTWISKISNSGEIQDEVKRLGDFYARLGISTDEAINQARKTIEKTHTWINGSLIRTNDANVPANFGPLVEEVMADYAAKHGAEEGVEAGDLTIREQSPGVWRIVDKATRRPVWNIEDGAITLARLGRWVDQKATQKAEDLSSKIKDQKDQNAREQYQYDRPGRG